MAIDDLVNKGKGLLNSEKAEQVSDDAFAKGSAFASEKTGGKYDEQIDQGCAILADVLREAQP